MKNILIENKKEVELTDDQVATKVANKEIYECFGEHYFDSTDGHDVKAVYHKEWRNRATLS